MCKVIVYGAGGSVNPIWLSLAELAIFPGNVFASSAYKLVHTPHATRLRVGFPEHVDRVHSGAGAIGYPRACVFLVGFARRTTYS